MKIDLTSSIQKLQYIQNWIEQQNTVDAKIVTKTTEVKQKVNGLYDLVLRKDAK